MSKDNPNQSPDSDNTKVNEPSHHGDSTPRNPFDVFHITPAYAIDLKALDTIYYALQDIHHPDRACSNAGLTSSHINNAYHTLKNPVKRAEALLNILSLDALSGDGYVVEEDEDDRPSDAVIRLSDLLEFQEAIMMCEQVETARQLLSELEEKIVAAQHSFSNYFEQGAYEKLPEVYGHMCYFDRLRRQIMDVEETLFQRAPVQRYM